MLNTIILFRCKFTFKNSNYLLLLYVPILFILFQCIINLNGLQLIFFQGNSTSFSLSLSLHISTLFVTNPQLNLIDERKFNTSPERRLWNEKKKKKRERERERVNFSFSLRQPFRHFHCSLSLDWIHKMLFTLLISFRVLLSSVSRLRRPKRPTDVHYNSFLPLVFDLFIDYYYSQSNGKRFFFLYSMLKNQKNIF